MTNVLLLKFIAVFAAFSVFVSAYAEWSGAGEEVAGWAAFSGVLGAGPGAWMYDAPDTPRGLTQIGGAYSVMYPAQRTANNYTLVHREGCAGYRFRNPDTLSPPEPQYAAHAPDGAAGLNASGLLNFSFPAAAARGDSGATDFVMEVASGDWNVTAYFTDIVAEQVSMIRVKVTAGWVSPRAGGGSCTLTEHGDVMDYFSNITIPQYPAIVEQTWHIKLDLRVIDIYDDVTNDLYGFLLLQFTLPYNASYAGNSRVRLWSDPDHPTRLNSPPAQDASNRCGDIFCSVKQFFGSVVLWFIFIVEAIVWGVVAAAVTFGWLVVVVALFFGGLFALSFSGVFGPAGPFVAIFTITFLAYLVISILYWVRGTGGLISSVV